MASKEAEALIQKYGGDWAADRANAEQIRQDAKAAGTWGNSGSQNIAKESIKTNIERIQESNERRIQKQIDDKVNEFNRLSNLVNNETTISSSNYDDIASSPVVLLSGGFFLGVIVTAVFFNVKIKKIKKNCDTRLNEARSALDRMLKIAAKD